MKNKRLTGILIACAVLLLAGCGDTVVKGPAASPSEASTGASAGQDSSAQQESSAPDKESDGAQKESSAENASGNDASGSASSVEKSEESTQPDDESGNGAQDSSMPTLDEILAQAIKEVPEDEGSSAPQEGTGTVPPERGEDASPSEDSANADTVQEEAQAYTDPKKTAVPDDNMQKIWEKFDAIYPAMSTQRSTETAYRTTYANKLTGELVNDEQHAALWNEFYSVRKNDKDYPARLQDMLDELDYKYVMVCEGSSISPTEFVITYRSVDGRETLDHNGFLLKRMIVSDAYYRISSRYGD